MTNTTCEIYEILTNINKSVEMVESKEILKKPTRWKFEMVGKCGSITKLSYFITINVCLVFCARSPFDP